MEYPSQTRCPRWRRRVPTTARRARARPSHEATPALRGTCTVPQQQRAPLYRDPPRRRPITATYTHPHAPAPAANPRYTLPLPHTTRATPPHPPAHPARRATPATPRTPTPPQPHARAHERPRHNKFLLVRDRLYHKPPPHTTVAAAATPPPLAPRRRWCGRLGRHREPAAPRRRLVAQPLQPDSPWFASRLRWAPAERRAQSPPTLPAPAAWAGARGRPTHLTHCTTPWYIRAVATSYSNSSPPHSHKHARGARGRERTERPQRGGRLRAPAGRPCARDATMHCTSHTLPHGQSLDSHTDDAHTQQQQRL
jgi:hypothetical protein